MSGLTPSPADDLVGARRDVLATIAIAAVITAIVAGRAIMRKLGPHPSVAQCTELLDRYVEHVTKAADPTISAEALASARVTVRAKVEEEGDLARCTTALTADEVDCAMKAHGADELERCLE